jgi:2C-methyl-D-erythritol 2,4-cyclodiphosphate synthase
MRTEHGYDVHRLVEGRKLIMGGDIVSSVLFIIDSCWQIITRFNEA